MKSVKSSVRKVVSKVQSGRWELVSPKGSVREVGTQSQRFSQGGRNSVSKVQSGR